jgi:hypothetical protein
MGQDFAVGEAGGVVDGDVQTLPAGAAVVALSGAIAGDAVTDAGDAADPAYSTLLQTLPGVDKIISVASTRAD